MRSALLVLTGCTKLLGVHEFDAPDAAIDAPADAVRVVDAPAVLPDADTLGMGLLAHLTFDGNPIGSDASGNGHGGSCNGSCLPVPGKLGQAVEFNGSSTMTLNGDFPTAAFTVAFWASVTNANNTIGCAVSRELGQKTGYALCFTKNQIELVIGAYVAQYALPTGFHHCGLTWDGTKVVTYLDGVKLDSHDADLSMVNSKIFVGWEGRGSDLIGDLDDLRYYGRVLSVDELLALTSGAQ